MKIFLIICAYFCLFLFLSRCFPEKKVFPDPITEKYDTVLVPDTIYDTTIIYDSTCYCTDSALKNTYNLADKYRDSILRELHKAKETDSVLINAYRRKVLQKMNDSIRQAKIRAIFSIDSAFNAEKKEANQDISFLKSLALKEVDQYRELSIFEIDSLRTDFLSWMESLRGTRINNNHITRADSFFIAFDSLQFLMTPTNIIRR